MAERACDGAKAVHVYPTFEGEPEHYVDGAGCWCEPELTHVDADTGGQVWTHRRPQ